MPGSVAAALSQCDPDDRVTHEIVVLEEGIGRPVRGAEVSWMKCSDGFIADPRVGWEEAWLASRLTDAQFLKRYGARGVTDRDGRVSVVSDGYFGTITAELGSLCGQIHISAWDWRNAEEMRPIIRVSNPKVFTIEPKDASGAEVKGLGIALRGTNGDREFFDYDGTGRIECKSEYPSDDMTLSLLVCGDRTERRLDLAKLGRRETVPIVCGPMGSVIVRVAGFNGASPGSSWDVVLRPVDSEVSSRSVRGVPLDDGSFWFPFVALDLTLEILARADSAPGGSEARLSLFEDPVFQGPRARGEILKVTLRPNSALTWLSGRAVDAQGNPFASRTLWIEAPDAHAIILGKTNLAGSFFLPVWAAQMDRHLGVVRAEVSDSGGRHRGNWACLDLGRGRSGRGWDLGIVPFERAALTVGGEVIATSKQEFARSVFKLIELGGMRRQVPSERMRWLPGMRFKYFGETAKERGSEWLMFAGCEAGDGTVRGRAVAFKGGWLPHALVKFERW